MSHEPTDAEMRAALDEYFPGGGRATLFYALTAANALRDKAWQERVEKAEREREAAEARADLKRFATLMTDSQLMAALADAYRRGVMWANENPDEGMRAVEKAAYDWADKWLTWHDTGGGS